MPYKSDYARLMAFDAMEPTPDWPASKPLRLIQYLGSKLRSLSDILPVLRQNTPSDGVCLDLFAGTTVVGQGLLQHCSVFSNDCLSFSKVFGDVLISGPENRDDCALPNLDVLCGSASYRRNVEYLTDIYESALSDEDNILAIDNAHGLGCLATDLPHFWNALPSSQKYSRISTYLKQCDVENRRESRFSQPACLFTGYYAGNYFGIRQAIEIDSMRLAIEAYRQQGNISDWQAKAFLAGLMSSCSRAVSTAGKHFAQPLILNVNADEQRSFALTRALSDRKVSIIEEMRKALSQIEERAALPRKVSKSFEVSFESLVADADLNGTALAFKQNFGVDGINTIYADPPYTAQQYSRFYHILETLLFYDYPVLQRHPSMPGILTQGLYRTDRHKSVFCSKTAAPKAFEALFRIAQQTSDSLVLSYSETRGTSGNPRMIDATTIVDIARRYTRRIEEQELSHNYRKLNRDAVNRRLGDPEKLYVFRF